jgi:alcohol dehydrogenase (NADP+)
MKTSRAIVGLLFGVGVAAHQIPFVLDEDAPIAEMPPLGFGTWNLDPKVAPGAVATALETGYRHIDCAAAYNNEEAVGKGLAKGAKKAGLKREDFWVTSKLWNTK